MRTWYEIEWLEGGEWLPDTDEKAYATPQEAEASARLVLAEWPGETYRIVQHTVTPV